MRKPDLLGKVERLTAIGIDLSTEKDHEKLLESILRGAREIAGADAGTLYLLGEDSCLHFAIVLADSLDVFMGGTSGNPVTLPPVPLYGPGGRPNRKNVVSYAALENRPVNIADAYSSSDYDFSGTRTFDQQWNYRSTSFLCVPMRDHEEKLIGVLQLINAVEPESGAVVPFSREDERLVLSLASQAAVALTRKRLIDGLEELLQSLVRLVATAIDEKSPYTGGHCKRVPELTMLLARAVNAATDGPYRDVTLSDEDLRELELAAWLHDCGKITTPEYVVDKATKLETIFDRIELVDARLDQLEFEATVAAEGGSPGGSGIGLDEIGEIRDFLRRVNTGSEYLPPQEAERIRSLAGLSMRGAGGVAKNLLTADEVENLCISKGTLTDEERQKVQNHIVATIGMLESLPFPEHLKNVPAIAGAHHERLDGKGYPMGLTADELSLQARMLALADIFEALTASDRPYRTPLPLSRALTIIGDMTLEGHIDPELFRLLVDQKLYLFYAEKFLTPEQIDDVQSGDLPGLG